MPLLYSVIARGPTLLAEHAQCAGNFTEVTEQIMSKISKEQPRLTYSHGSYLFHYVYENEIVYLCIADNDFDRTRAFMYLNEIKRRFQLQFGANALNALPYSVDSEFSQVLASQMKHFSQNQDVDKMARVQGQIGELKEVMIQNIDSLVNRGEKLDLLVDKADDLSSSSVSFKKASRNLARSMCLKNAKITIFTVLVVIVVVYIIVTASCGGFRWKDCV